MAIDVQNPDARTQLQKSVRYNWEHMSNARNNRETLIDIYRGHPKQALILDDKKCKPMVNLFVSYVTGHLLSVSYRGPKWAVNARTMGGRGFDKRIQNFLNRYSDLLELPRIFRQCALDSAFGYACIKVTNSLAPTGVTAAVAPRAFRVRPSNLIIEQAAASFDEATFIGDVYLAPLSEARNHPDYNPEVRATLQPWRSTGGAPMVPRGLRDSDVFAEEMTRLVDIYLPTSGVLVTWPAQSDTFAEIANTPLGIMPMPLNPYCIINLLEIPDTLEEFSRLDTLSPLNMLANDMLHKVARQARQSKRNPIGKIGDDQDLENMTAKMDGEGLLVSDPKNIDLYQIPGPDPSIVATAQMAQGLFSGQAGNLEVALGQSAGAQTARQTQALIGQINARQQMDRERYEAFAAEVGKKLASLAFENEELELEALEQVPGTKYVTNFGWAPPNQLPRPGKIGDFNFEVVPFSASFRSPEERLAQLQAASGGIMQWMMAKAQGAPVNLEYVMEAYGEAFDMVPQLKEFWSGEDPPPAEQASQSYTAAMQHQPGGAQVNYNGGMGGGGGDAAPFPESAGGMQSGQGV